MKAARSTKVGERSVQFDSADATAGPSRQARAKIRARAPTRFAKQSNDGSADVTTRTQQGAQGASRQRQGGFSVLEEEEENPAAHAKIRSRQATNFVRRSAPTEEEDEDMEAGEDEDGMLDAMANARAAAARK